MANSTRDDAVRRIWYARPGSMIGASENYLIALRAELSAWLAAVNAEIERRTAAGDTKDKQSSEGGAGLPAEGFDR